MKWRSAMRFSWLAATVTGAGCGSLFAPHGIPKDPLILSKQPIESKGHVTPFEPLVYREPTLPPGKR